MSKNPSQSLGDQLKPYVAPFRLDGSGAFHLRSHKTNAKGGLDKDKAEKILEANRGRLNDFQERLYAQDRWSLLVIFQGMDAAGKDSAIKSIFEGVNPQGCEVTSFKQPSSHELNHDFMWRSMIALPERGRIGIFNRSYYEECLVTRVHPELLRQEKIPPKLITRNIWRERFEDIAAIGNRRLTGGEHGREATRSPSAALRQKPTESRGWRTAAKSRQNIVNKGRRETTGCPRRGDRGGDTLIKRIFFKDRSSFRQNAPPS